MNNNNSNNDSQNPADDDFDFDSPPESAQKKASEVIIPQKKSKAKPIIIISILVILIASGLFVFFNKSSGNNNTEQNVELTEIQLAQFDKIINNIFIGEYVGVSYEDNDPSKNNKPCHLFISQLIRGIIENGSINYTLKGNFKMGEVDVYLDQFNIPASTALTSLSNNGKSLSALTMYLKSYNGQQLTLTFENQKNFKGVLHIENSNKYIYCFATKLNDPDYKFILANQLLGDWKGEINGQSAIFKIKPYLRLFSANSPNNDKEWGLSSDCKLLIADGSPSISFFSGNIFWKSLSDQFKGTIYFATGEDGEHYIYEAELTGTIIKGVMQASIKGFIKQKDGGNSVQIPFRFTKPEQVEAQIENKELLNDGNITGTSDTAIVN